MATIKITQAQADEIYATRKLGATRKAVKKTLFAKIKRDLGISSATKIKINILNPENQNYLAVQDKRTGRVLTNSAPEPTISTVATTAEPTTTAAPTAPAKPVAKAPAKPVAKAPARPDPKTLGSPTKTGKYPFEVRTTINGERTRLGYASSEAEKAKMIAAAK